MTHGRPVASSRARGGVDRSGWSVRRIASPGAVNAWQGGLAWIASKCRSRCGRYVERPAHELERVARLRVDVDADHVEPGAVVSHRSATGAAEQVEELHPHRPFTAR